MLREFPTKRLFIYRDLRDVGGFTCEMGDEQAEDLPARHLSELLEDSRKNA